jgi:hypothetical protein
MPQNLSYIERELARVTRAAADTENQMRDLERAISDVIRAGTKGGGTASPASVSRLTQQSIANPYNRIAGTPVGNRAIVGSEAQQQARELSTEYNKLKTQLAQTHAGRAILLKAEAQLAAATQAKAAAVSEATAFEEAAGVQSAQRQAAEKAALDAEVKTVPRRTESC